MPQQCDGMRTEPPMSVPSSNDVNPAATAAAGPPDEPPGMRSRSHGLFVVPKISLKVWRSPDQRGRLVLPNTIAPGRAQPGDGRRVVRRHVVGQLDGAAGRADAGGLDGVLDRDRQPVQRRQRVAARASGASAASASARARSASSVTTALIGGSSRSMRSRYSSSRSRLVISPARIAAACSVADRVAQDRPARGDGQAAR